MNDLLTDSFVSNAKGEASREIDLEKGTRVLPSNSDMGMEAFNKQIQEVEVQVNKLSGFLIKLKDANEESKSVTKASEMKAIKKRMEKDIDEVGKIARDVKGKLEAVNKDNLTNRHNPGCEKGTAIDRARMNVTNALTRKFKDLMIEFQTLRQRIQDEYREVVERRVITVTGTRPDETMIDHLIETGNSEQIFQNAFEQMGRGQVISTVEEIQERHDAVKEIEKRLSELHQIYLDMAVLVEAQSEILDNIENQRTTLLQNAEKLQRSPRKWMCIAIIVLLFIISVMVTNAVDHVRTGTDALQTAKSLQKRSRKCMMIAIIILLVVAILIVLSILKPWKKN